MLLEGKLAELEPKLEKMKAERDTQMAEVNAALRTNNDLTTKLHAAAMESAESLREQERKFTAKATEMEARLKGSTSGASNEDMLKLQLEITKLEKEHMAADATANREKIEAEATLREQLRVQESAVEKMTRELQTAVDLSKDQEAKLVLQKDELGKSGGKAVEVAVKSLQVELAQEQQKVKQERQDKEKLSARFNGEQQLMASAWYDLVLQNQRLAARSTDAAAQGLSFLQKQRNLSLHTSRK